MTTPLERRTFFLENKKKERKSLNSFLQGDIELNIHFSVKVNWCSNNLFQMDKIRKH